MSASVVPTGSSVGGGSTGGAVATPSEVEAPLYRGVRGELPKAFWYEDKLGMLSAVDAGFMSTSLTPKTPIEYMQEDGPNVLWTLHPRMQSDAAFHRGADISPLSQVANEQEVLLPA